jgi:hypothetical protein
MASLGTRTETLLPEVTAVLTLYNRPDYFFDQLRCIEEQSVPCDIWVDYTLCDANKHIDIEDLSKRAKVHVRYNHNLHIFGRFYLAMNITTPYVFIVDDDIFPQPDYVKSCIQIITEKKDAIAVAWGCRFSPKSNSYNKDGGQFGWNTLNSKEVRVDWGGHAWFFKRSTLNHFNRIDPIYRHNGEDLHLSFTASVFGNVPTYVPPHPVEEPTKWSTIPKKTKKVSAQNALNGRSNHKQERSRAVQFYRNNNWKYVLEK